MSTVGVLKRVHVELVTSGDGHSFTFSVEQCWRCSVKSAMSQQTLSLTCQHVVVACLQEETN